MIIQYKKIKCDNCGKEEMVKENVRSKDRIEISIVQWSGSVGQERLVKDTCSDKCALELIKGLKRIPKKGEPVKTNIF